ncbi:hypothetical protein [Pseudomonas virus PBPA162]|uniref:Uncharacterized protein n=2 Tax=Iggyvirus TaxID=3044738 RepID=A0A7S5AYV8_9CAUD|nr:hypothetical protein PQC31_gp34 [Pseudomonas phage Iggy]YP_010671783.1 hypothetical protein PQC32_gp20 [Pseudomonas virus PBPA162]QDB70854.1 hypothetical protein [Pseudomonas virus PBPA162]QEA09755.1 hypothetical protein [Pseudomonas phage Iggy]
MSKSEFVYHLKPVGKRNGGPVALYVARKGLGRLLLGRWRLAGTYPTATQAGAAAKRLAREQGYRHGVCITHR